MIQRRILYRLWLRRIRKLIRNDQLILSVLAVVVGAAAAFGTILIRLSITYIEPFLWILVVVVLSQGQRICPGGKS